MIILFVQTIYKLFDQNYLMKYTIIDNTLQETRSSPGTFITLHLFFDIEYNKVGIVEFVIGESKSVQGKVEPK